MYIYYTLFKGSCLYLNKPFLNLTLLYMFDLSWLLTFSVKNVWFCHSSPVNHKQKIGHSNFTLLIQLVPIHKTVSGDYLLIVFWRAFSRQKSLTYIFKTYATDAHPNIFIVVMWTIHTHIHKINSRSPIYISLSNNIEHILLYSLVQNSHRKYIQNFKSESF